VLTGIVTLTVPAFVLLAWCSRYFITALMGRRWSDAGTFAAILAAPACSALCAGVLDRMMDLVGQQKVALTLEVAYTFSSLAAFAAGVAIAHSPLVAISTFAGITVLYHIAWVSAVYWVCKLPLGDLARTGMWAVGLATGTTFVFWLGSLLATETWTLVTGLAVLAVYYLFATRRIFFQTATSPQPHRHFVSVHPELTR